jgi:diguanylate cyclase (GGDEF)-like protein
MRRGLGRSMPDFFGRGGSEENCKIADLMLLRRALKHLLPGALLLAVATAIPQVPSLWRPVLEILPIYFSLVFVGGFLLAWQFDRSRIALTLLALALADRALLHGGRNVHDVVALLLPVNLAAFSWLKERGLLTPRGAIKLGALLLQALGVAALARAHAPAGLSWLSHPLVNWPALAAVPLRQPALAVWLIAAGFVVARFVTRPAALEAGLLWAVLTTLIALLAGKTEPLLTFYIATAGLILVVSLMETSRSMAFDDELTGLPGRRALNEELLKLGSRYAIAMVDIDHFKPFNDDHGHDVGDQLLRMVGARLLSVGGGGRAFRYGGEEFSVLFDGKTREEAAPVLEKFRAELADTPFIVRGKRRPRKKPPLPLPAGSQKKVSVTVSIGVAEPDRTHGTPDQVVKAADAALYRAKRAGRNRLCT